MIKLLKQPVTMRAMCAAGASAAVVILITVLILPNSATPLAELRPFLTMFSTAVFLFESLTAYFLAIQFYASRDASLAALAGGYGFTAVLVLFQILVFPGIFSALRARRSCGPWKMVIRSGMANDSNTLRWVSGMPR